ncbi:lectin-related NK cell receptor ly49l1-like protein [Bufonid herpesvirus 1]|uniref:lectin-related NK cell receptor ly49l1-like protein n=1 Tax=Bufonid herpesvirus 1 TaxID=2282206 RepID=UPI000EB6EEE1|nr:lectin-related NK cell receptor ly49l1-like protein [Bufonid herpesvirus 1]AXF48528.1 lectin-related NK cell receptor ly49l1-like protein [Bufonid herpesvirus 1]
MGAGEEPTIPECVVLKNEQTAYYSKGKLQQSAALLHKTVLLLVVAVVLGTIAVTVTVIIIRSNCFQSCTVNNKERKDNTSSILPAVADTIKVQQPDPCLDDWVWYRQKCYYFSEEHKTWEDSQEFCKLHNASLVIIESKKELKFLFRSKESETKNWIGLKSTDDNTGWIWVNGTLYTGDIFPIPKLSSKTQYLYLSKKNINAHTQIYENHWICSKSAFS